VKYVTLGGNSPRVAVVHAFVYTPESARPRILDFPLALRMPFPEFKNGGDLLVTDQSSRFRFADAHYTSPLNHAEALWSSAAQERVLAVLSGR